MIDRLWRSRKGSRRPKTERLGVKKNPPASFRFSQLRLEPLEQRALLTGLIDLGPSDNVALDQPRVAVEFLTPLVSDPEYNNPDHWGSVGPSTFNTLLLDTGANSVLAMATAVSDLTQPPYVYETQGDFIEAGVAGDHEMDISVPYRFDFAGTDGIRNTVFDARILSDANNDFSIFGPWGLAGMPAMVDRVTSLDMTVWSTNAAENDLFMHVDFSSELPADNGHRYSVAVDNRLQFDPVAQTISGDPPVWGDIPFLTTTPTHNGQALDGNFLFDTGAQISVISESMAFELGLDANGNGTLDDEAIRFETVGGVGGTVTAPVVFIDEVRVATEQDVDLVWTDLQWLVLDIEVPGETTTLDGVFGSDLLTSGWVETFFEGGDDGYFQQVHFDFREMETNGTGTIHFDLTPASDVVIPPGPGARVLETLGYTQVAEGGAEDYYRIVLTEQPAADVVVSFEADNGEVTVVSDDAPGTSSITFTPDDWDVPKLIRVDAVNDDVAEGAHTATITHTFVSDDPEYNGRTIANVDVTILDDDLSLLIFTESNDSTSVAEGGAQDTYTVQLESEPTTAVWVQMTDPSGQVRAYDPTQTDELLQNILIFTYADWDEPQTVVVEAIDDSVKEGPHHTQIVHEVVEVIDLLTFEEIGTSLLSVDVADNDVGAILIAESDQATEVSEAGQVDTYSIVLNETPTATVRIDLTTPDGQVTAVDNAQPLNAYLEFTPDNWNTPQTVRVEAVDDLDDEGRHTGRVVHTTTSTDPRFDAVPLSPVVAQITDDDLAGLLIAETDGSTVVASGGGIDTYQIVLKSQPSDIVRVELGNADGQLAVVDDAQPENDYVQFTPDDWNIPRTVRVSPGSGAIPPEITELTIVHSLVSTDADYRGQYQLPVTVMQNTVLEAGPGDDTITVAIGDTEHVVTINGVEHVFDRATVTEIHIDGLGGNDAISILGTAGDEDVVVRTDSVDVAGPGYSLFATNVNAIHVDAGSGQNDRVALHGSASSNRLYSRGDTTTLTDSTRSFSQQADNFDTVTVDATEGQRNYAYLYDSPGDDLLDASPESVVLDRADGWADTTATGFQRAYVYANNTGNDTARFTGSETEANRFYSHPDYARLTETRRSFYYHASGFETVEATSHSDATSYAYFYDGSGNDAFTATPTQAGIDRSGTEADATAVGFQRVYAYATRGGNDTAELTGSDNRNQLRAYPTHSTLTDSARSFYHFARGFDSVTAIGSATDPSADRAYLYDASGNDLFYGRSDHGYLEDTAGTYHNEVWYFDLVYARSTDSDSSSDDAVDIDDSLVYDLIESGTWG